MAEIFQLLGAQNAAFGPGRRLAAAIQRRAKGAHQPGNGGADDLHAHLFFKGAQHGVVQKGAALHHHLFAQLLGPAGPDDLVQCIFYHTDGEARRDILNGGPILLGLLHRGVHEHRAAAAQLHRGVAKQAQLGKVLHIPAQGLGKGLQEAAAARGAGLVEEDIAHRAILYAEAFHVLPANVDDEIHLGLEVAGRRKMGHGLHQAVVAAQGLAAQQLAIAGGGGRGNHHLGGCLIQGQHHLAQHRHGVAAVGLVALVQHLAVLAQQHGFQGGAARVYAQVRPPAVARKRRAGHVGTLVAVQKFVVFLLVYKQRLGVLELPCGAAGLGQLGAQPPQGEGLVCGQRRANAHEMQAAPRQAAAQLQHLVKGGAQLAHEGEGAAQVEHISLDGPPLGQPGHRLVHHRVEDGGGHVLGARALVDKRLHVGFGKHPAAAGDGVDFFLLPGLLIQLGRGDFQKGGHLVDKSAGAPGAAAVHPHLHAAGEKEDFRVLAPQLNHHIGVRGQAAGGHACGKNLLHKGHAAALGKAHARRAGDGGQNLRLAELRLQLAQQLGGLFGHMGEVPLVALIQNFALGAQHHAFYGGAANIQPQPHPAGGVQFYVFGGFQSLAFLRNIALFRPRGRGAPQDIGAGRSKPPPQPVKKVRIAAAPRGSSLALRAIHLIICKTARRLHIPYMRPCAVFCFLALHRLFSG